MVAFDKIVSSCTYPSGHNRGVQSEADMPVSSKPGRTLRVAVPLLAMCVLCACTLGGAYRPPVTPAAARQPFASTTDAPVSGGDVPDAWWQLYRDPVLDQLVRDALEHNRELAVAAANVRRAQAMLDTAEAARSPSTDLSLGLRRGEPMGDQMVAAARRDDTRTRWAWTPGVSLSWEADLWGRMKQGVRAAVADAEAAQADADALRVAVAAQTATAYIDACGFAAQQEVAQRSLDIAVRLAELTRRQHAHGLVSSLEVTRAQAAADDTRATLPVLEAGHRAALYELAVLTGRPPAAWPDEAAQCRTTPELKQPFPVGDGAALLQRRPDLRALERRLAAASARVGVATAELYPTISLGASADWLSASGSPASLGNRYAATWGIGPLIRWQFPHRGAARARLAGARADGEAALAAFDARVLLALKETEQALVQYGAVWRRQDALRASRDEHARALALAERGYKAGAIDFLDLLDAQRTLATADAELAANARAIGADQVLVFKALGGGWQVPGATISAR